MDNLQEHCLFCAGECIKQTDRPVFPILPGAEGNTYTNSQLWSLFVLQKILEYPQENITGLLKDSNGIELSDWFVLCVSCSDIIKNSMETYQKLLKVQNEFEVIQSKLVRKIHNSLSNNIHCDNGIDKTDSFTTNIRNHFLNGLHSDSVLATQEFKIEPEVNWGPEVPLLEFHENDDNNSTHSFSSITDKANFDQDFSFQKEKNFYCQICICRRLYTTRDSFMKHLWRHRNHKYPCAQCKFPCETEKALKIHHKRNLCNESNELKCDQCEFVTVKKMDLKNHQIEMHPLSSSSLKDNLNVSKKRSKGQQLTLTNQSSSKDVKAAKNLKLLSCNVCSFTTKKRSILTMHLKRHEYFGNCEKIDGKLKCKLCDDLFPTRLNLIRHFRQRHGNEVGMRSFICTDCCANFGDLQSLNCHIASTHTKQFKYYCDVCGMGFVRKNVLERHLFCHDGKEKCFICDLCGAQLKSDGSLKMHMKKVHSSNRCSRKYTCKFCKISGIFLNKSILNRHIREKHNDLYIYKCGECDSSYLSQASLLTHKTIKHGNEPAECKFCQKKVLNKAYLSAHYQKYCRKKPVDFKNKLSI